MRQKQKILALAAALGMLVLILDSKTALKGATEGIDLCVRSVIPSLFPFFVLSSMLTSSVSGRNGAWLQFIGKIFHVPAGAETLLLTGILGGYPVGARAVSQAVEEGQLSPIAGRRMMAFCSNAGPSFIFGIAAGMFPEFSAGWLLWAIQILSAMVTARFFPGEGSAAVKGGKCRGITEAVRDSVRAMANVCAWVILFRVLIVILDRWFLWLLPDVWAVFISGLLELSNGCLLLDKINDPGVRFILCSAMLSFGGICVTMQTLSQATAVDSRLYLPGKTIQACISVILAWAAMALLSLSKYEMRAVLIPLAAVVFLLLVVMFLRKAKKRSGNPAAVGV